MFSDQARWVSASSNFVFWRSLTFSWERMLIIIILFLMEFFFFLRHSQTCSDVESYVTNIFIEHGKKFYQYLFIREYQIGLELEHANMQNFFCSVLNNFVLDFSRSFFFKYFVTKLHCFIFYSFWASLHLMSIVKIAIKDIFFEIVQSVLRPDETRLCKHCWIFKKEYN